MTSLCIGIGIGAGICIGVGIGIGIGIGICIGIRSRSRIGIGIGIGMVVGISGTRESLATFVRTGCHRGRAWGFVHLAPAAASAGEWAFPTRDLVECLLD